MNKEIKFIEYNGIEGYIELMKHDVEPLNNPNCKSIELYYDGKDIKAVLDYITNLQKEIERLKEENKRIFSKVNDDELLISNAMNYAEAQDYKSRIDKAIEYLGNCDWNNKDFEKIYDILKGDDKQ